MPEQAIAETESTQDDDEERDSEPRDEAFDEDDDEAVDDDEASDDTESESAAAEPTTTKWAIRGAIVGAVAGGAAGAGVGVVVARRPEALKQARDLIGGNGRRIAMSAALAATEALTPGRLSQLFAGDGNGDRSEVMKQTARDAGAAAAKAARDGIISLRRESIGSES